MLAMIVLLSAPQSVPQTVDLNREMIAYRQQTRARVECDRDVDEIVVCGRREADEYRAPLVIPDTGERDNIGAFEARQALLRQPNACETKIGNTPYGCGFAGVTMTSNASGTRIVERERAP